MNATTKFKVLLTLTALSAWIILSSCSQQDSTATGDFEKQVGEYIQKFPYQDTHNYAMNYTQGDPAKFNTWVLGSEPVLVKAGRDKVVRMNNDTFYKMAFVVLDKGPVVLGSSAPAEDRFNSFQLMDDRNVNYRNVIYPKGQYTLYHGTKPARIQGEAIKVPSKLSVIIVRVEVKDKGIAKDMAAAKKVFNGITIDGPTLDTMPELDLLSGFDNKTEEEALRRMEQTYTKTAIRNLFVKIGQQPGKDISYLNLAAGTKCCWGGPDPAHSAYETIFTDDAGNTLKGANGTYTITTEEPQVDAFWSITVYDTERGGFLHPNKHNRYHINNTSAETNSDGTVTFTFKQQCREKDQNCLEVPAGAFDVAARYYLPKAQIISGKWTLSKAKLQKN